jgi:hypothetical protein
MSFKSFSPCSSLTATVFCGRQTASPGAARRILLMARSVLPFGTFSARFPFAMSVLR